MDCPNCGVYNPESRDVCWRCDKELPRPPEKKPERDPMRAVRRTWLILALIMLVWITLTWIVPLLTNLGP